MGQNSYIFSSFYHTKLFSSFYHNLHFGVGEAVPWGAPAANQRKKPPCSPPAQGDWASWAVPLCSPHACYHVSGRRPEYSVPIEAAGAGGKGSFNAGLPAPVLYFLSREGPHYFEPWLWIRIRLDSHSFFLLDPDPHSIWGSGSRRVNMSSKN